MKHWQYRVVIFDKIGLRTTTVFDSHGVPTVHKIKVNGTRRDAVARMISDYFDNIGTMGWELVVGQQIGQRDSGDVQYTFKREVAQRQT